MSVTPTTLSAIQQAGQSIDEARRALAEAVTAHAQRVMTAVAEQPFNVDNDKLFAYWKTAARLAQEVQAIEEQFKTIYQTAEGLLVPETPVLTALPQSGRGRSGGHRGGAAVDTSAAEDVEVKVAVTPPAPRKARAARPARAAAAPRAASGGDALSTNDAKLLAFLKTALNRKSWKRTTHGSMAQGAGMPLGSVGLALRRLIAGGRVVEGEHGHYKLA